ncbi:MAG: GNAT family N-acetyltransferase [Clostridiales bacterium]|nr:GNAT family N-acetyltransferase [Clostridiales bacterium]
MEFSIERAYLNDSQVLSEIIESAFREIERKEWFVADDSESIRCLIKEEKGIAYKAVERNTGEVAGVLIAAMYGMGEENLGHDIGLAKEELKTVAHMESVAVLPKYRGYGLQYSLMQEAQKELVLRGFRYLMCTIHPDNFYSKSNAVRQGYEVVMTKEKYGGYIRDILLKKLD